VLNSDLMKRVMAMVEAVTDLLGEHDRAIMTSFPRNIERLITFALQVPVIRQPGLTLLSANKYLCALRGAIDVPSSNSEDRKLNGLLYIGSPCAIIFVCAGMPAHIESYILAHELGHLLADVFLVQRLWLKSLSEKKDVIRRYFSWDEADPWLELRGFFKGLPLRPRAIIGRGQNFTPETSEREIIADLFAREIIAPWAAVELMYLPESKREFAETLRSRFHLPLRIAADYHDDLRLHLSPKRGLYDRLLAQSVALLEKKPPNVESVRK
jgi:Zn-dependent peptidase ImmA (M78 family)